MAALHAVSCASCGRKYNTKFAAPPINQTQAVNLPYTSVQANWTPTGPTPASKPGLPLKTIFIAVGIIVSIAIAALQYNAYRSTQEELARLKSTTKTLSDNQPQNMVHYTGNEPMGYPGQAPPDTSNWNEGDWKRYNAEADEYSKLVYRARSGNFH